MKHFSIFLVAAAFAASAWSSEQDDSSESGLAANDSRLLRMTWEVNSCLSAGTTQECFSPAAFRLGDRLHIRAAETGNCSDRRQPVVLSFVQDNNRVMNIFFGCIVSDESDAAGRKLEIAFVDDPPGTGEGTPKMLTVQHVRVAGDDTNLDVCKQRLSDMSKRRLNNQAERLCRSRPYASLIHWSISTRCVPEAGSVECNGGQVRPAGPPEDGQGTGSGQE
ncbi:MAG: hypothetical protein EA370_11715 [Wenzhouxiangella sp.]|nr:MAG: hypothetical protein EA370_11715 [Wenzhouxiangella sp.]